MKKLVISFHSVVDVITNSSTVVYTGCSDGIVESMKGIVDSILKAGGSNKTSDDLYTFKIVPDDSAKESMKFAIAENPDWVNMEKLDTKEAMSIVEKMIKEDKLGEFFDEYKDCIFDYENRYEDTLVMECKVPEAEKFVSQIYGLFWHEGGYDG